MQEVSDATTMGLNPFADFIQDQKDDSKPEGLESPLSPSVYDKAPDPEMEKFIEPLLGEDTTKALKYKANMLGVGLLAALRQTMAYAFLEGKFACVKLNAKGEPLPIAAEDKRNGNDNNAKSQSNLQIRALIRQSNYGFLNATAQGLGMSNIAAFKAGVDSMLDTANVMKRIKDSELAMEALEKKF